MGLQFEGKFTRSSNLWDCNLKGSLPDLQTYGIALECSDEALSNFLAQVADSFIQHLTEDFSRLTFTLTKIITKSPIK